MSAYTLSPSLSLAPSSKVSCRPLCASLWSCWSPAPAICQMSSTVSSVGFAAALLGPVHLLSPDQQSGIHCPIICGIQLLTPNNSGETWRRICSLDIRSVSTLEMIHNHALQIDIYLLTYLFSDDVAVCLPWHCIVCMFVCEWVCRFLTAHH